MKRITLGSSTVLALALIVLLVRPSSRPHEIAKEEMGRPRYAPQEILVKFKEIPGVDIFQNKQIIQNAIASISGRIKTYRNEEIDTVDWDQSNRSQRSFLGDPYLFHIKVPRELDLNYAISCLKLNPYVEYAESNSISYLDSTDPNDEHYGNQWGLKNSHSRQSTEPPAFNDIHAPEAWDFTTGSPDIVVAVLDSGIKLDHPDLAANIWTNPNDSTVDENDNDDNGYEDDWHGWDFSVTPDTPDGDNDPSDEGTLGWHGTAVSGIIGAVGNNEEGISGVCWNVKIMPLKIFRNGYNETSWIIHAIDYAIANGAFLMNASWHKEDENLALKDAIARAQKKNRLFVCAAGNTPEGGINIDDPEYSKVYPSSWTLGNILSVLATKYKESIGDEERHSASNYGPISVDVCAPGNEIWTTNGDPDPNADPYRHDFAATSAATPFVAGTGALILSKCPVLTFGRLKSLILDNVDKLPLLDGICFSDGRVNAFKALNALSGTPGPNSPSNLSAYPAAWNTIEVRWKDNSNNELGYEIQRIDGSQTVYVHENCRGTNSTAYAYFQDSVDASLQKTYTYRVRAANKAGISSFSNSYSASASYSVPSAPTDLSGQSPTLEQHVNVSWSNHATNALYNFLERTISGEEDWEVIATLSYNADMYWDNSAQAGYTYQYRLRAWNPLGYSGYSNIISIEVIDW